MKKIACLGLGAWGYCLASLLAAKKKAQVFCWTTKPDLVDVLTSKREHPLFPGYQPVGELIYTTDMAYALDRADLIVEAVTSAGIRPVFEQARSLSFPHCPIVITSKGIEQDTGKILPDVVVEVLGNDFIPMIGCLSGPSFAQEVIRSLPTSVVASGYALDVIHLIVDQFTTSHFRVYPNTDLLGVVFGGALKNVIAIACGIAEGLGLGNSCRAALMTRGLHEIRKLAIAFQCKSETMYGLSGMGDLCLTCSSPMSRNFRFGVQLAEGATSQEAQDKIGMVVEGAYTSVSVLQLSKSKGIPMPISETVYKIIYEALPPTEAVQMLMQRTIKEEHL